MSTETYATVDTLGLSDRARLWFLWLLSMGGTADTFDLARELEPGAFPRLCHELRTAGLVQTTAQTMTVTEGWLA